MPAISTSTSTGCRSSCWLREKANLDGEHKAKAGQF